MQTHNLIAALAAMAATTIASPTQPRAANAAAAAAAASTLNIESFLIYAYQGDYGQKNFRPQPPSVSYTAFLSVGNQSAWCQNNFQEFPNSNECAGKPAINGFSKPLSCPPVNDAQDGIYPLNNATWSITKYKTRFVIQYNVPDPKTGKTLVACDGFNTSQIVCESEAARYEDYATSGEGKNLTLSASNVCPKY